MCLFLRVSGLLTAVHPDWPDEDSTEGDRSYHRHAPRDDHNDMMVVPNAVWAAVNHTKKQKSPMHTIGAHEHSTEITSATKS